MSKEDYSVRIYKREIPLKYGCNPHQKNASVYSLSNVNNVNNSSFPFKLLNGNLGYINMLDAIGCWNLVVEAKKCFPNYVAATSFKHTSPAGAALSVPLSDILKKVYFLENADDEILKNDACIAYIRARNSDPMSSFGDFIGINCVVDEILANVIKREVSDGIVAPGYTKEALEILSSKKSGKYVVLQGDISIESEPVNCVNGNGSNLEFRELGGVALAQTKNTHLFSLEDFDNESFMRSETISNDNGYGLNEDIKRDLIFGNIVLKYSQSNNVLLVKNGQTIGISAGQQSRVHSTRLAIEKSKVWLLRQHPKALQLMDCFKPKTKKQTKINAIIQFIEGYFTENSMRLWCDLLESDKLLPNFLLDNEKRVHLLRTSGICLCSDAFFPFRDSIDIASQCGVRFIMQPGGSMRDDDIIKACDEYGMAMIFSGIRIFTH